MILARFHPSSMIITDILHTLINFLHYESGIPSHLNRQSVDDSRNGPTKPLIFDQTTLGLLWNARSGFG